MAEEKFNPMLIDNDEDSMAEFDPVIQQASLKKNAGIADITRQLSNIPYAGTGTKLELIELEENLRELLEAKTFGYKFIEGMLISMGYNLNKIRQAFRKLTGTDPDVYMKQQPCLDTPGTIPGINYGWGESKDSEYDYYFVMPYNAGFSVFGQKGDLLREEAKYLLTLQEAQDFLKKKVKEVKIWDPIVETKKLAKDNWSSLSENWPMGTKTASVKHVFEFMDKMGENIQLSEKRALLEEEVTAGNLTEEEFYRAAVHYGIIRQAKPDVEAISDKGDVDMSKLISKDLDEDENDSLDKSLKDSLDKATPQSFFDKTKRDVTDTVVPEAVESILVYFAELGREVSDFDVNVFSFQYMKQVTTDKIEKTLSVGKQQVDEHFNSSGNISVIMDIKDKTLPVGKNIKQGLAVFKIVGNDVKNSGTFKGEDDKIYGLNSAGFLEYFEEERSQEGK